MKRKYLLEDSDQDIDGLDPQQLQKRSKPFFDENQPDDNAEDELLLEGGNLDEEAGRKLKGSRKPKTKSSLKNALKVKRNRKRPKKHKNKEASKFFSHTLILLKNLLLVCLVGEAVVVNLDLTVFLFNFLI